MLRNIASLPVIIHKGPSLSNNNVAYLSSSRFISPYILPSVFPSVHPVNRIHSRAFCTTEWVRNAADSTPHGCGRAWWWLVRDVDAKYLVRLLLRANTIHWTKYTTGTIWWTFTEASFIIHRLHCQQQEQQQQLIKHNDCSRIVKWSLLKTWYLCWLNTMKTAIVIWLWRHRRLNSRQTNSNDTQIQWRIHNWQNGWLTDQQRVACFKKL